MVSLLPSLRGLPAIALALLLIICSTVITTATRTGCFIGRPMSTDTLPIYPHLALSHATHIQGQRFITCWRIEESLAEKRKNKSAYNVVNINADEYSNPWMVLWHRTIGSSLQVGTKEFNLNCLFTLYQVRGCFWDASPHSTLELPLSEWRLRASPCKPICTIMIKITELWYNPSKQTKLKNKSPGKSISARKDLSLPH